MSHLQKEERLQIQTLLEMGHGVDYISKYIGRHRSTIYREMNRSGVDSDHYSASIYHNQARKNMSRTRPGGTEGAQITKIWLYF